MRKIVLAFFILQMSLFAGDFIQGILAHQNMNYKKAAEYFKKAAEQGVVEAQLQLGYMHEYGEGMKQDYSKAFAYYKQASDANSSTASYLLGTMYEDGRGVKQSFEKAQEAYMKACKLDDSHGCVAFDRLHTR